VRDGLYASIYGNPNQWPRLILSSSTTGLLKEPEGVTGLLREPEGALLSLYQLTDAGTRTSGASTHHQNGFGLQALVLEFLGEENGVLEEQHSTLSEDMAFTPRPHQTEVVLATSVHANEISNTRARYRDNNNNNNNNNTHNF